MKGKIITFSPAEEGSIRKMNTEIQKELLQPFLKYESESKNCNEESRAMTAWLQCLISEQKKQQFIPIINKVESEVGGDLGNWANPLYR